MPSASATHDVFDQREGLSRPLLGSLLFHAAVLGAIAFSGYLHFLANKDALGDPGVNSQSFGEVTAANTIPLPRRDTTPNPVANPSESDLPKPKPKAREVVREDPNAIPLKSRRERKKVRERELRASTPVVRQEPVRPNQLTSDAGRPLSSPMYGVQGNGGVGIANTNPFGYRFGAYAAQLQRLVSAKWQAQGSNVRTSQPAVLTVEIQRDGSFRVVSVAQSSGNYGIDTAARRALSDITQFPPLPPGFDRSTAVVDFSFKVF